MMLRRPLVPLVVTCAASTLLFCFLPSLYALSAVGIFVFGFLSVRHGGKKSVYAVLCLIMLFLSGYPLLYENARGPKEALFSEQTEYRGTVQAVTYGKYTSSVYVRLTDGEYDGELCRITVQNKSGVPSLFETIRFYGTVLPVRKAVFGEDLYRLYSKNVRLCATDVYDWTPTAPLPRENSFRRRVYFRLRHRIFEMTDGDTQAMVSALLTSDRTGLSKERTDAFRRAGLYPFLCISGVHVMLTVGLLRRLLVKRRVPLWIQVPLLTAFLCAFVTVGGASGSVLRAGIMAAVMWIAPILTRQNGTVEYDSVSALCLAFLILWLGNPYMPYDLGTVLSFIAALGVIMASELRRDMPPPGMGKYLFPSLCASVYATGFTSLLCVASIGGVALLSPFSNLAAGAVFAPTMGCVTITALLCLLPSCAAVDAVLRLFALISRVLLHVFEAIARVFAAVPHGYVEVSLPWELIILLSVGCFVPLIYCLAFCEREARSRAAFAAALIPYGTVLLSALYGGISEFL